MIIETKSALRCVILTLLVFLCPVAVSAAPFDASPSELAQETARALKSSKRALGLQTELPIQDPSSPFPDDRLQEILDARLPFNMSAQTAKYLLYTAVAILVIMAAMTFHANMWSDSRSRRIARKGEEEVSSEAVSTRMGKAQLEADDFARNGDFAEAMHVLLLQSISELRRRLAVPISISLTSREILYKTPLLPEGRSAFSDIIGRVEISYFGTHLPSEEDYLACRHSFDILSESLKQGAAA